MIEVSEGRGFRSLIDPIALDEFITEYWEQRPLYIPGDPEKVRGLFDLEAFYRVVSEQRPGKNGRRPILKVGYKDREGEHAVLDVEVAQVEALMAAGMTVQAEWLDRIDPRFDALVRAARSDLALTEIMDVGCFISPDGSGYGLHFDATAMWIVQIEGQKRWRFSATPAVRFPPGNVIPKRQDRDRHIHGLDESKFVEHVLSPGDVLYLPAGTWHQVQAIGQSMHLCLTVGARDVMSVVRDILDPILLERPEWRHVSTFRDRADSQAAMEAFFADRIAELRSVIEAVTPRAMYDAWARLLEVETERPPEVLEETTLLEHGAPFEIASIGDEILLVDAELVLARLPADTQPFLERIRGEGRFEAKAAMGFGEGYAWEDVRACLSVLLEIGFVRRAE